MLEKGLISARKYPEWYKNLDANDIRLMSLLDSGYIVPLMKKDQSGRQVIFSSLGRFDTEKFKIEDSIRLNTLIYNNFMEDEGW